MRSHRTTPAGLITPMVYGGWFWTAPQLQSLQRESSKRGWVLLGILTVDLQPLEPLMEGPVGWWPGPPSDEGGTHPQEKRALGRLVVWHHSLTTESVFFMKDWI